MDDIAVRPVGARVVASAVGLLTCAALQAAPVTGTQDESADANGSQGAVSIRPGLGAAAPKAHEVSTGNRNLDLLLDMQAVGAARAASRPASAAIKVPLPNTNLSGGVLTRIQSGGASAPSRHDEVLGDLRSDLRAKATGQEPAEQRQWSGLASQGGGGSRFEGSGAGESRERAAYVEEPAAMRILRESVEWLRQNRWEVLGALLGLAAIVGLLKAYARRP